ncbi:MAG: hypothetical protein AAGC80_17035 [Rhodococcus sp. (in: high G+C Gram-positive bacteria)]
MFTNVTDTPTPAVSKALWSTEEIKARLEQMDIPRSPTRRGPRWGSRDR